MGLCAWIFFGVFSRTSSTGPKPRAPKASPAPAVLSPKAQAFQEANARLLRGLGPPSIDFLWYSFDPVGWVQEGPRSKEAWIPKAAQRTLDARLLPAWERSLEALGPWWISLKGRQTTESDREHLAEEVELLYEAQFLGFQRYLRGLEQLLDQPIQFPVVGSADDDDDFSASLFALEAAWKERFAEVQASVSKEASLARADGDPWRSLALEALHAKPWDREWESFQALVRGATQEPESLILFLPVALATLRQVLPAPTALAESQTEVAIRALDRALARAHGLASSPWRSFRLALLGFELWAFATPGPELSPEAKAWLEKLEPALKALEARGSFQGRRPAALLDALEHRLSRRSGELSRFGQRLAGIHRVCLEATQAWRRTWPQVGFPELVLDPKFAP